MSKSFEIGKYYKHTCGGFLHIIAESIETTMWGSSGFIAEKADKGDHGLMMVGRDEASSVNYSEITVKEWMSNFS